MAQWLSMARLSMVGNTVSRRKKTFGNRCKVHKSKHDEKTVKLCSWTGVHMDSKLTKKQLKFTTRTHTRRTHDTLKEDMWRVVVKSPWKRRKDEKGTSFTPLYSTCSSSPPSDTRPHFREFGHGFKKSTWLISSAASKRREKTKSTMWEMLHPQESYKSLIKVL